MFLALAVTLGDGYPENSSSFNGDPRNVTFSNLLCVWVEAVSAAEQRLAIRTFDCVIIFLVLLAYHLRAGASMSAIFFIDL